MPYEYPPEGTILPPRENNFYDNPPSTSSGAAYGRFLQAVAQDEAYTTNVRRKQNYLDNTFNSWYTYSYSTGKIPYDSKPPEIPSQQWVSVIWDSGIFIDFVPVDNPNFLVCSFTEVPEGWWIAGTFYKKQPKPQH